MRYAIIKDGIVSNITVTAGGPPFINNVEGRECIDIGTREDVEIGMSRDDFNALMLKPVPAPKPAPTLPRAPAERAAEVDAETKRTGVPASNQGPFVSEQNPSNPALRQPARANADLAAQAQRVADEKAKTAAAKK